MVQLRIAKPAFMSGALALVLLVPAVAAAQAAGERADEAPPDPYATRFSVMAGLLQWTAFGGGNLALELKLGRLAFEYSHGQALDFNRLGGFALSADERDAGVEVTAPWTTGGGIGFQITPEFHALVEFKAHHYRVRGFDRNQSASYTTFSIGPGLFYSIYLYKNLFIQPNLRFWPTVASSLDKPKARFRRADGSEYQHETHDLNFFANVNLGWTFGR